MRLFQVQGQSRFLLAFFPRHRRRHYAATRRRCGTGNFPVDPVGFLHRSVPSVRPSVQVKLGGLFGQSRSTVVRVEERGLTDCALLETLQEEWRGERRGGKERCKPVESGKGLRARERERGRGRRRRRRREEGGGQEGKGRIEENARSRHRRRRRQRRTRGRGERRGRTREGGRDGRTCGLAGWAGEGKRGKEERRRSSTASSQGGPTRQSNLPRRSDGRRRWRGGQQFRRNSQTVTHFCGGRRRRRRLFPPALCARSLAPSLAEPILSSSRVKESAVRTTDRQSS